MHGIAGIDPGWGVTAVRVATASILTSAGYQKLAGGVENVAEAFGDMGLPEVAGPAIAVFELVGGAALLVGLFGRWIGLLLAVQFMVAAFYVKLPGAGWGAARLDVMLLAAGVLLFLAGSGKAAVDERWTTQRKVA